MPPVDQVENPTPEETAAAESAAQAAFEGEFPENAKPAAAKTEKPEPKAEKVEKDTGEVKPDPKLVQQAAEKAQADETARLAAEKEWDGVPTKVRQMLEGISSKIGALDKIDHRLKGVEGRAGAALNQVEGLKTALAAARDTSKDGGAAPTPEQIAAAAKSNVKWKQVKEDYPDWAEAMEERLAAFQPGAATTAPGAPDVAALKKDLGDIVAQATSEAKAEARELAKIDRKHENWEETINTPEFTDWRNAQPPEIQALGASTKAVDAIKMLDAFDAHLKAVAEATAKAAANKKRLDGAVQPKGAAAPASTRNLSDEAAAQQGFNSAFT